MLSDSGKIYQVELEKVGLNLRRFLKVQGGLRIKNFKNFKNWLFEIFPAEYVYAANEKKLVLFRNKLQMSSDVDVGWDQLVYWKR